MKASPWEGWDLWKGDSETFSKNWDQRYWRLEKIVIKWQKIELQTFVHKQYGFTMGLIATSGCMEICRIYLRCQTDSTTTPSFEKESDSTQPTCRSYNIH